MADDTQLTYNGLTLSNVITKDFIQEPVYDDSGTDVQYHKFTVTVSGLLHPGFMQPYPGTIVDNIALSQAFEMVRNALSEPRRDFEYKIGDQVILAAVPALESALSDSDVANGPKPLNVRVTQLAGARMMRVELTIEICKVQCGEFQNSYGVLSNRWSSIDDYDQDFYCTRTISGRLRVAKIDLEPHSMRSLVVPPLQPGFKRQSMNFNVDTSGLVLDYSIIDRQVAFAAPGKATSWQGRHTISAPDGVKSYSELEVELTGPPSASKTELIMTAVQLVEVKLALKLLAPEKFHVSSLAIVDHLHENRIGVNVRLFHVESTKTLLNLDNAGALIGKPIEIPNYNRFRSPVPPVTGEISPIGLFVAYWQSPCNDEHSIFKTEASLSENEMPTESSATEPVVSYNDLPTYAAPYSESHLTAIYESYAIESEYIRESMVVMLPLSGRVEGSNQTAYPVQLTHPEGGRHFRIVRGTAARIGAWPEIPPPEGYQDSANGVGAYLLKSRITPEAPQLAPDGQKYIYRSSFEYRFGLTGPPNAGYRTGSRPYDQTDADQTIMPLDVFKEGIL
jgi:hypothetical protein